MNDKTETVGQDDFKFVDPEIEEPTEEEKEPEAEEEQEELEETEAKTDTEFEDQENPLEDEEEKKEKLFSQSELDNIVSNRLAAEKAKHARDKELWEQQQEQVLKAQQEQKEHHDKLVKKAVEDGLIEATDDLANPKEFKQQPQAKTYYIDQNLTQESYLRAMNKLTLSALNSGMPEAQIKIIDSEIGMMMQQDAVPIDLVPEAAKIPNGIELIQRMVTDAEVKESVVLAGLKAKQTGNIEDFRVEFKKIADGLAESEDKDTTSESKQKPKKKFQPSKREHLRPGGASSNDDDVEVPVAKW